MVFFLAFLVIKGLIFHDLIMVNAIFYERFIIRKTDSIYVKDVKRCDACSL